MEYTRITKLHPIIAQKGYIDIKDGISVGFKTPLDDEPITTLHYHQCVEIGVCCNGSGESYIGDHRYRFSQGCMQCVRSNMPHLSRCEKGTNSSWIWIFINPYALLISDSSKISTALTDAASKGFSGVFTKEEHPKLASLISDLIESHNSSDENNIEMSLIAGQIIIEMGEIGDTDHVGESHLSFGKLQPAISFIKENYADTEKMKANIIANSCGMSVSHFRLQFKKLSGMTLPQYINKTRLSYAVYLLNNTDIKITDIALSSGFNDVSYFNRVFLKEFGTTPYKMRKQLVN